MINLIKLCVGVDSIEELEDWREQNRAMGLARPDGLSTHRTRQTPKRAAEIIGQGSLYWVIGGEIRGRQKIVGLESSVRDDGVPSCLILMDPTITRTVPAPRRPFQGWRYLKPDDAPADLDPKSDPGATEIISELVRLGLL